MPKNPIAKIQSPPLAQLADQCFRANAAHGFIYLNNPKVGCSTIKSSLWRAIRGNLPTQAEGGIHALENSPFDNRPRDPVAARSAFVFTFVRNPFQRLVSAYLNKVVKQDDTTWPNFAARFNAPTGSDISFDGFVEVLSGIPPEAFDPHWRRQQLNILYPFVKPNLIGDLEQLNDLLPMVMNRLFTGSTKEAGVIQERSHSTNARQVWREHFKDHSTLRRFLDIYGEDFEAFGYVPDVAAEPASRSLPLQLEHSHDGLAALIRYWAAPNGEKLAVLSDLIATDPEGMLADWILSQRLLGLRRNPERLADVLERQAGRIAQGSAYLRRIAAEVRQTFVGPQPKAQIELDPWRRG